MFTPLRVSPSLGNTLTFAGDGWRPFDPAYERIDDSVRFSFSLRDPQPSSISLRLYEIAQCIAVDAREPMVRSHIKREPQHRGFEKSGRFVKLGSESLDSLAARHGLAGGAQIFAHPLNAGLRKLRKRLSRLKGRDILYLPQVRTTDSPIPLGGWLQVEEVDEQVAGGRRYGALWNLETADYDPLDWMAWKVERMAHLGNNDRDSMDAGDTVAGESHFMPQFAVRIETDKVYLAPTPLRLVEAVSFEGDGGSPSHAFLAGGDASEGVGSFTVQDDPMVFLWS